MESRNMIFSLLFNPADAICVYFDVDPERCEKRALNRIGHPKLKGERRVKSAIDHFRKSMEPPQLSEGFKGIWTVKTFKDADTLIEKWSKKANGVASSSTSSSSSGAKTVRLPNFFKFPRTEHLFNTGSATDDDLVHFSNTESIDDLLSHFMSQFTTSSSSTTGIERKLTIEEKIDGANLGITAYRKKYELGWKLKVQNRSHYVNSKSHAQFGTLDRWIEQHREELLHLLVRAEKRGEEASESFGTIAVQNSDEEEISDFILFGEWCRATHSIHYDSLPDEFIAFDLFDCNRQRYVGRSDFHSMIEKTTINTVPVIFQQTDNQEDVDFMQSLRKKAGWFQLLEGKSKYRVDGGLEGVYLRVDERDNEEVRWWNRDRLKLVRSDFIAGNEHWSKGIFTKNIVIYN
ncbi:hypothetical protein HK098_007808 [Nowakowskiella sp. JEL0407]|nr:hypothetical protein HK098_007808 [Nowakowskiella sp. JEL0407]